MNVLPVILRIYLKNNTWKNFFCDPLDRKGFHPNMIEDAAPYTVEIGKFQKYGELLKNSVESYPLRDKIVLVMKDL